MVEYGSCMFFTYRMPLVKGCVVILKEATKSRIKVISDHAKKSLLELTLPLALHVSGSYFT